MIDYLIVGLGLAGVAFCEELQKHGKTFLVISDDSQNASLVAGGLYNPVALKRLTLAWDAHGQIEMAVPFYKGLEQKLKTDFTTELPILRRFASIEEQNQWFEAMDWPGLSRYLSPEMVPNGNPLVYAPFGFGELKHTGRIDTAKMLQAYAGFLLQHGLLKAEAFDYAKFEITDDTFVYQNICAKHVIFAEGFGVTKNPFFNYLPIYGTKGQYLIINAPALKAHNAIKAGLFCIPLGNDNYKVGATYEHGDTTAGTTQEAKTELIKNLEGFLKCGYTVLDQMAGIRPMLGDRKPVIGRHPKFHNMLVFNGLGSRGILSSPSMAAHLIQHTIYFEPLPPEVDNARFTKKYFKG